MMQVLHLLQDPLHVMQACDSLFDNFTSATVQQVLGLTAFAALEK